MPSGRLRLPKQVRLRRPDDYRKIYREGSKFVGPLFAAFYRRSEPGQTPRVGYTTPRSMGKAVVRNRIRRRLREAVRLRLPELPAGWDLVFNPRRSVLDADFSELTEEVGRLFGQLRNQT